MFRILNFREKEGLKNRLIGLIVRRENREREAITVSTEQAARSKGVWSCDPICGTGRRLMRICGGNGPETGLGSNDRLRKEDSLRQTGKCGGLI